MGGAGGAGGGGSVGGRFLSWLQLVEGWLGSVCIAAALDPGRS